MANQRMDDIEAALAKATPGPWKTWAAGDRPLHGGHPGVDTEHDEFVALTAGGTLGEADAALIVLLRNNAADLLALAKVGRLAVPVVEAARKVDAHAKQHPYLACSMADHLQEQRDAIRAYDEPVTKP